MKLFPVLVEEYDLSGSTLSKFKQIIVEQGQKGFHHLSVTGESSHGRWDPFSIEESLPVGKLFVDCLQDYVNKLRCKPVQIDNTWFNVLPTGGYTRRHRHEYSVVSGALYLDLPQNSGDLYFVSPLQPYRMCELHEDYSDYNAYEFDLPIKENHLYLFPSWLEHGSRVNESDQDRIMVSFNTSHYTPSS